MVLILKKTQKPITVQEISSGLLKKNISANKTTIYRELEFLLTQNIIDEIEFGDGKKRYELRSEKHHHHIVCIQCGKVEDIDFDVDLKTHEKEISKKTGFEIKEHNIEFFGLCQSCQS